MTPFATESSQSIGQECRDLVISGRAQRMNSIQLSLFAGAIHALYGQKQEDIQPSYIPTCPDISLPWSEDVGHNGWSAKTFLHQMICLLRPHWKCLDTERLLSGQMPLRLRVSNASEISLLHPRLKKIGKANSVSYLSEVAIQGIILRNLRRDKQLRVLLHTEHGTTPVIVTYSKEIGYVCLTEKNVSGLADSLKDGLLDFLNQRLPE